MAFSKIVPGLFSVVIFVFFLIFIIHFSTGIPQADDYPMMFQFLDRWAVAGTIQQKYILLTEQFLDHRMVAMKLTVLAVKAIFDKMDINVINGVGVLIWLSTIFILFKAFSRCGHSVASFLPVLFFAVHPGYGFDGLFWAATWMAFPWAIFFSVSCFYCLTFYENKTSFVFASTLSIFAMFSHGNGILCCIISLLILVFQKKYKRALSWLCLSGISLFLFFYNYKTGGTSEASPIENLLNRPFFVLSSIGAFNGGSIFFPNIEVTEFSANKLPAIVFGLLLSLFILGIAISLMAERVGYSNKFFPQIPPRKLTLFLCAIGLFVIATSIMISCVRTGGDVIHGFAARYHFYSALLLSVIYMFVVSILKNVKFKYWFKVAAIGTGFVYCVAQYWYQTAEIADYVRIYQAGLYNSKRSGKWVLYKDARFWERGLDKYSNENIWSESSDSFRFPPVRLNPDSDPSVINMTELSNGNTVAVADSENNLTIRVKGISFQFSVISAITDGVYMNLVSESKCFLYPLRLERTGFRQFVKSHIYYKSASKLEIKKKWFSPGLYQLHIFIVKGGERLILRTNKTIKIKEYPFEV